MIHQQTKKNAKTDQVRRMLVTVQLMIYWLLSKNVNVLQNMEDYHFLFHVGKASSLALKGEHTLYKQSWQREGKENICTEKRETNTKGKAKPHNKKFNNIYKACSKKDWTLAIKTLFYNILSTVPFKLVHSTGDTPFPTFLPLLELFLELTFCDDAQFSYRISRISACSKKDRTF